MGNGGVEGTDYIQHRRSAEDQQYFSEILKGGAINCLYLFSRVSVVMNGNYIKNFWPQFEFFLATRKFDPQRGFRPSRDRVSIKRIQSLADNPAQAEALFEKWDNKNVAQARSILAHSDVQVTNQSDKEALLPKLEQLEAHRL